MKNLPPLTKRFILSKNSQVLQRHLSIGFPTRISFFSSESATHVGSGAKLTQGIPAHHTTRFLRECVHGKALPEAKRAYIRMTRRGFESGIISQGNDIINANVQSGHLEDARQLFDKIPKRDEVFSTTTIAGHVNSGRVKEASQTFDENPIESDTPWTSMITGHVKEGNGAEALKLFGLMNRRGMKPNPFILSSVLRACASTCALEWGKQLHGGVIKIGFEENMFVGNSLATMYAKGRRIEDSKKLFDEMRERDVVSWTTMIVGLAQSGHEEEASQFFGQMMQTEIKPNDFTVAAVLGACGSLAALQHGKQLHAHVIRTGLVSFVSAGNALAAMYAKCGSINDACQIFDEISVKDVVSWTTMIMAYVDEGLDEEALRLAFQMRKMGTELNEFTFPSVLSACANIAILEKGKQVHALISKTGLESHFSVKSAIISMYSKCGNIEDARQIFDSVSKGDVVTWTAIIAGYAMHGHGIEALQLFKKMQQVGVKPDSITFIGVLSACCNAGLVDEGMYHFNSMTHDHGIDPTMVHYGCMIDLLGRAGRLDDSGEFIKKIPLKPDAIAWGALLGACKVHGKLLIEKCVAQHLLQLEPQCIGTHMLLANIYAEDGRWADAANVRQVMKDKGLKKQPGRTWIEVRNKVYTFVSGDRSHPQTTEIYAMPN